MAEIQRKKGKGAGAKKRSQGAVIKDAIMTGVSYMIPFIVGGGCAPGHSQGHGRL